MLDIGAKKFSPYFAPRMFSFGNGNGDAGLLQGYTTGFAAHDSGNLHQGDTQPVHIISLAGDINGDKNSPITLALSKKAEIIAGRDISDLGFSVQHTDLGDVTRVIAGRDFIDSTIIKDTNEPNLVMHLVHGAGAIDFRAWRNFDLGDGSGVVTRGNLDNPYLAKGGASINILAGSNVADYTGFLRDYVKAADLDVAEQTAMSSYVAGLKRTLNSANPANPVNPGLAASEVFDAFLQLSDSQKMAYVEMRKTSLNKIFFAKLLESGQIKGLSVFDAQIAKLFPNINAGGGNINIFGSQLKTEQGGAIDMFTPGGSVYAGLANTPSYLVKPASTLGVFTIQGGDVRAQVKTDFLVNQGRVFTVGGGDISLVSQYGDLNAGKGSKTASSSPPPLLSTDQFGNTILDISGSISGSGIATLKTNPGQADSNITAVAPRGTFDAGDAGLRSSGKVILVANVVLNAGNITASGSISGAPAVDTSALSTTAAPSIAAVKAEDVTERLNRMPPTAAGKSTTLSVDVLGYGSDCTEPGCAINGDGGKKN